MSLPLVFRQGVKENEGGGMTSKRRWGNISERGVVTEGDLN